MDVECQIHPLILVFIKNVYAKVAEKRSTANRYKKLSYSRRTARRAMSMKISSTVAQL